MVLTEETKTDAYPAATMETATATTEETLYSNVSEIRENKPNGYPHDLYLDPNGKVAKLNGSSGEKKIGPGIVLKVMAGDKFNLRASSWYKLPVNTQLEQPANPLEEIVTAMSGGVAPLSTGLLLPKS